MRASRFLRNVAVCFDIDGVLMRGSTVLEGASEALQLLKAEGIPYAFMTNGGGSTEINKCNMMTQKLGVKITTDQMLQCHTPFRDLVNKYGDQTVMVLGKDSCVEVAESYGFKNVVKADTLLARWPTIYPLRTAAPDTPPLRDYPPIAAAFIVHDPLDWAVEMQVLSDVLLGHVNFPDHCASTKASTSQIAKQVVPLYSSNDDLLYNTEHPLPRYTQGAFMQTFEHLFKLYSGIELEVNRYGKPHRVQFQYAEKVLIEKALKLGASSKEIGDNADDDTSKARPVQFDKIYMIGDNPRSDVRGARIAGQPWESILLGTGIHRAAPGVNDSNDPADHVVHGVLDAINLIVEKNRSY